MDEQQVKGGPMARQAAMLCQDPAFRLYLDRRRRYKWNMSERDLPDGTHNEQDARDWLCAACQIDSRFEAERMFRKIRNRFNRWRAKQTGGTA